MLQKRKANCSPRGRNDSTFDSKYLAFFQRPPLSLNSLRGGRLISRGSARTLAISAECAAFRREDSGIAASKRAGACLPRPPSLPALEFEDSLEVWFALALRASRCLLNAFACVKRHYVDGVGGGGEWDVAIPRRRTFSSLVECVFFVEVIE